MNYLLLLGTVSAAAAAGLMVACLTGIIGAAWSLASVAAGLICAAAFTAGIWFEQR